MIKNKTILKKVNQTGSMMIEALAMLTLISLVTPTLYKKSAERTTELQDINTATHVRTLMKAVDNYTSANYQSILEKLDADKADVVNVGDISAYLPYGYKFDAVKNFDTPIVTVKRQGETDSLTSFVIFPKIGNVNDLRASRIASMIGANGGYVDKDGEAKGVGGIWSLNQGDLQDLVANCQDCDGKIVNGSIVAASSENINEASRAGTENSKYLQRTKTENEEWRNTMMTDLYMGGVPDILQGNADIPLSKILGVDQLIIGDTKADAGVQSEADLVVRAREGNREGAAFIEGSLRALGGNLAVFNNEDENPELNFANNLLKATKDQFSINVTDADKPNIEIAKVDEAGARATLNVETKIDNTLETTGDTTLASGEGSKFYVGQDGRLIEAEEGTINMMDGQMVLSENEEGGTNLYVATNTVQIDGNTTMGTGSAEPMIEDLDPKLNVQGNAFVSNKLEAGEVDAHKFDALELHAGGKDYETDENGKYQRWLNVDRNGVFVQDLSDSREDRLVINNDESSIYGPLWEDSDGNLHKGAINLGDSQIRISAARTVDIGTQSQTGNVSIQSGAIMATGQAGEGTGNTVDFRAQRLQVAGSDNKNVAFEIIPGEGDERSVSSVASDVDQFVVQKNGKKLLNIVSGENSTSLREDSVAEIDPEKFRIWAKTTEGNDVNNRIFEVNAKDGKINANGELSNAASVYVRRGAIEIEGAPNTNGVYKADEGVGYIEASRFVANNLRSDGQNIIEPRYANSSNYDGGSQIDRYMVNPAYTSVMHDIKLTTRGGARLSDILPDFINKGIYIVNNTYEDGINFNNLNVTNDNGVIKANGVTEIPESATFQGSKQWASPYMGMIPAPQCPPGHARVITITPASFQMAQTGDMVLNSDGRYYVQETTKANELSNIEGIGQDGIVTSAEFQPAHEIVKGVNPDGTPQIDYIYYIGLGNEPSITKNGKPYSPKPLYFQQSTWLKSKVIAYGAGGKCSGSVAENGGCNNFLGWAAVMGFIYPYELYQPIIDSLRGEEASDTLANRNVYWNVFPVRTRSMEAYATVYCYFDRTNIFGSGNDPQYVDQYDQLRNFRDIYQKSGGTYNGRQSSTNEEYIKRLDDPHLKYKNPW